MKILEKSSVELIDHMGDDLRICASARVSTGAKATKGEVKDKKLIDFLWRNGHTSPFEQVNFTFKIHTPIFVARQIMRHRTGKFNEMSGRYRELPMEFFLPKVWRKQNTEGNKQGSIGEIKAQRLANILVMESYEQAERCYLDLLREGVANEQARMVLPVGLFTEFYLTIDLHNLLKFIGKRIANDAQPEIQEVARQMLDLIKPIVPWSLESFNGQ